MRTEPLGEGYYKVVFSGERERERLYSLSLSQMEEILRRIPAASVAKVIEEAVVARGLGDEFAAEG